MSGSFKQGRVQNPKDWMFIHFGGGESYEVPPKVGECYFDLQQAQRKYEAHLQALEERLELILRASEENQTTLLREALEWSRKQGG